MTKEDETFKRRMLRHFISQMEGLNYISSFDMEYYKQSRLFSHFMLRVYFAQMVKAAIGKQMRQLIKFIEQ